MRCRWRLGAGRPWGAAAGYPEVVHSRSPKGGAGRLGVMDARLAGQLPAAGHALVSDHPLLTWRSIRHALQAMRGTEQGCLAAVAEPGMQLRKWISAASAHNTAVVKEHLRKLPALAAVNRVIKARRLRAGLAHLAAHYGALAAERGVSYDEAAAWAECQRRVHLVQSLARPQARERPRVFWVGANRDQDESGFLQALRRVASVTEFRNWKGGYGQWYWDAHGRVQVFDPSITAMNDSALMQQVEAALQGSGIDLLMGQMWANYVSAGALARVRELGVPVVNVSMDDRLPDNWATRRGTRLGAVGLASVSDLVLTTSSETCLWYALEGCPAVFWPLASDPDVFAPQPGALRDIDVLFVGNKYGIRESIVRSLNGLGVHVECYGAGWPNGPATAEQSASLFKRARIILGVGTVGYCDDVFTLKLRDFDAPMSGALYLTHRAPDLSRLYQEGREIECYATPEEAASKIRHYLAHPDDWARIASAGHAKAVARDTWQHRLQTTLSRIGVPVDSGTFPAALH